MKPSTLLRRLGGVQSMVLRALPFMAVTQYIPPVRYAPLVLLLMFGLSPGCDTADPALSTTAEAADPALSATAESRATETTQRGGGSAPRLLSAFYGLDNQIPAGFPGCQNTVALDGLPVVFSRTLDPRTLQASDFVLVSETGVRSVPDCATLLPAIDPGELRTVLLVGEFGSPEDQPVLVVIRDDLFSGIAEGRPVNFKGVRQRVVPLEAGPSLALAEAVPPVQLALTQNGCPEEGTVQVVRAVWEGGITKPGGAEVDDVERELYRVAVRERGGEVRSVTPFAFGDLNDGDNNHLLCLDVEGRPLDVSFPAGAMTDPNDDLNPATSTRVR